MGEARRGQLPDDWPERAYDVLVWMWANFRKQISDDEVYALCEQAIIEYERFRMLRRGASEERDDGERGG